MENITKEITMKPKEIFGEFFKAKRIENKMTLRKFCEINNLDPGNISKTERGILPPPSSDEKLRSYAFFLEIKEGSSDWQEFFDRAAARRGEIPREILEDSEVVRRLPLIFRTIRGKKVSKERLDEIIEIVKDL